MDGSSGSYVMFGLVMALSVRLKVRGHGPVQPTPSTPRRTYNASDGVPVDSRMCESIRWHAHEVVVGLLLRTEVCVVHGGWLML